MILPCVVEAKHDGRFRIRLVFSDKTTKTVDFRRWLKGPVFTPLKDVKYFQRFFLDGGTVVWPNGADIAPETLYDAEDVGLAATKKPRPRRGLTELANRLQNSTDRTEQKRLKAQLARVTLGD